MFTKYFIGTQFPKFAFYSAHAETMYPILKAFDFLQMEEAYPGSALFVEFFESEGKDRVRLLYKKDAYQQ